MTRKEIVDSRGDELTERERRVLEAVVRTYVDTAEPAGSRTVARRSELGVSPATIRNTMADLEEKGYLDSPHASSGRIPTDLAYRFFVDQLIRPASLTREQEERVARELEGVMSGVERLVRRAARALSVFSLELGVAMAPRLEEAVLEKLDLVQASSTTALLVATIRSGVVRTLYIDLPSELPADALGKVAMTLNERLAGLTLREIRETLPQRLRDARADDEFADELLNIFMQSGSNLFDWPDLTSTEVTLGQTSVLASQPEFTTGERLKGLIELTEQRELLAAVLGEREHPGGIRITIGDEHEPRELAGFTLVTAEYRAGGLKGVVGVIGPTRMEYEKVIAIVDYTSSIVNRILKAR